MKVIKITCILFIMTSITWSCNQGSSGEKESIGNKQDSKEQVQSPAQQTQPPVLQTNPTGEPDQYGRKPGDPHYGHGHAPGESHQQPANQLNTPQATPLSGEPDSRGRKPGDQHYGHDHD